MPPPASQASTHTAFGDTLREHRNRRRLSQLDLALETDVSSRHLSFLETGRAQPSRTMITRLADSLELDLRSHNELLSAAGFAPAHRASALDAESMAMVNDALTRMLASQEPYPAIVFDRNWILQRVNTPFRQLLAIVGVEIEEGRTNLLELMLRPGPVRDAFDDWNDVASLMLQRASHDVVGWSDAADRRARVARLAAEVGAPDDWRTREVRAHLPVAPITFRFGDARLAWITTAAAFGAPNDVTAQELVIEFFHPADEATRSFVEALAGQ